MADNTARTGKSGKAAASERNGSNGRPAADSQPKSGGTEIVQARIEIPSGHPLVTVFGAGDGLLRVIEKAFPGADIHARGNQVTLAGTAAEVGMVQRLFEEMLLMLRTGAPLTEDSVE